MIDNRNFRKREESSSPARYHDLLDNEKMVAIGIFDLPIRFEAD